MQFSKIFKSRIKKILLIHNAIEIKMSFIFYYQNGVVIWLKNCLHLTCEVRPLCIDSRFQLLDNYYKVGVEMQVFMQNTPYWSMECLWTDRLGHRGIACLTRSTFFDVRTVRAQSYPIVYLVSEVHLSNVRMSYGWEQTDFYECWSGAEIYT